MLLRVSIVTDAEQKDETIPNVFKSSTNVQHFVQPAPATVNSSQLTARLHLTRPIPSRRTGQHTFDGETATRSPFLQRRATSMHVKSKTNYTNARQGRRTTLASCKVDPRLLSHYTTLDYTDSTMTEMHMSTVVKGVFILLSLACIVVSIYIVRLLTPSLSHCLY